MKFITRNREKYFEIREKYFRISKTIDKSTPHSDFLKEFPKSGLNSVLWKKTFVEKQTTNDRRFLKQKIEGQLYSTAGDGTHEVWKT